MQPAVPDSSPPTTEIATITYRSGPEWDQRFGRRIRDLPDLAPGAEPASPALCPDFLIETYLDHQVSRPDKIMRSPITQSSSSSFPQSQTRACACRANNSVSSMTPTLSSTSPKLWTFSI